MKKSSNPPLSPHLQLINIWQKMSLSQLENRIFNIQVHNKSKTQLTYKQIKLLALSHKFIPTPKPIPHDNLNNILQTSTHNLCRSIRLEHQFGFDNPNNPNTIHPKFRIPNPTYVPKAASRLQEQFINNLTNNIPPTLSITNPKTTKNNLNKQDWQTIKTLANNTNITILPSDKNLGLTVVDTEWYNETALGHLNNPNNYTLIGPVENNSNWDQITQFLEQTITTLTQPYILPPQRGRPPEIPPIIKFIRSNLTNFSLPKFYILPKVHKPTLSSRPIAGAFNWITTPASTVISHILHNKLKTKTHFINNTQHLISYIDIANSWLTSHPNYKITYIITGDVENMYPNIPIGQLLAFLIQEFRSIQNDSDRLDLSWQTLRDLCKLILQQSYLQFAGNIYRQIDGIAMGTNGAPQFADLFMYRLEQNLPQHLHPKLLLRKRFIDDILILWTGTLEELQNYLEEYNNLHHKIKITWNIHTNAGDFLDLHLFTSNQGRQLEHSTHQKIMNTYLYIPFMSYHRTATKKGWIKGELLRYRTNSSTLQGFITTKKQFYRRLQARGYPCGFLNPIFASITWEHKPPIPTLQQLHRLKRRKERQLIYSHTKTFKIPNNPSTQHITKQKILDAGDSNTVQQLQNHHDNEIQHTLNFQLCWTGNPNLLTIIKSLNKKSQQQQSQQQPTQQ